MKVQIVIAALATLLLSAQAEDTEGLQCAGGNADNDPFIYEKSGFLTASFTQDSCKKEHRMTLFPGKKGNDKCCKVPESVKILFVDDCHGQNAGPKYKDAYPHGIVLPC